MKIIAKLVYFQLLWFFILYQESFWVYFICLGSLIFDWYYFSYPLKLIKYLSFTALLITSGACLDLFFNYLGLISWSDHQFYPMALNQIWIIFSVYFADAFKKFKEFLWLGFLLAFFGAPLAYYSGSKISSITFDIEQKFNLILFGLLWASNFIMLLRLHREKFSPMTQ